MSVCRLMWRAAVRRQPFMYSSGAGLFLQPLSSGAPPTGRCWVQPLFTSSCFFQVREQKPRTSLQNNSVPPLTSGQKVRQAGTDFAYFIVAIIGVGITVGLLYVVISELFSSSSPNKLYGKAFEKCRNHPEVIAAFGEPIKAFGETTKRGRRQHVASTEYIKNDLKCMRLKFYISGSEPRLQGVVYVESKQNPQSQKFEFQYIVIEIDTIPRRTITVEDNREMF